jgi:hypothetical protein
MRPIPLEIFRYRLSFPLYDHDRYTYKADGTQEEMEINENFNFKKLLSKFDVPVDKIEGLLGDDAADIMDKVDDVAGKVGGFFKKFT